MATNPNTRDFPNAYFKEFIDYQDQQNLTQACETYLQTFQFPIFELLLVLQVKDYVGKSVLSNPFIF